MRRSAWRTSALSCAPIRDLSARRGAGSLGTRLAELQTVVGRRRNLRLLEVDVALTCLVRRRRQRRDAPTASQQNGPRRKPANISRLHRQSIPRGRTLAERPHAWWSTHSAGEPLGPSKRRPIAFRVTVASRQPPREPTRTDPIVESPSATFGKLGLIGKSFQQFAIWRPRERVLDRSEASKTARVGVYGPPHRGFSVSKRSVLNVCARIGLR